MDVKRILAIDPGSEQSAWLLLVEGRPWQFDIVPNDDLLLRLRHGFHGHLPPEPPAPVPDVVVIEQIRSYGMAVGAEIFDTVHWSGRFTEAARPSPVVQLPRRAVKLAICGNTRAKDANIRQALLDRFGGSTAKGTKANPGPLYGISKDVWSALAIAVSYADGAR